MGAVRHSDCIGSDQGRAKACRTMRGPMACGGVDARADCRRWGMRHAPLACQRPRWSGGEGLNYGDGSPLKISPQVGDFFRVGNGPWGFSRPCDRRSTREQLPLPGASFTCPKPFSLHRGQLWVPFNSSRRGFSFYLIIFAETACSAAHRRCNYFEICSCIFINRNG